MTGLEKIYNKKNLVAQIVRKNINLEEGIHFFSSPKDSLQLAHHSYKKEKETRVHHNKITKPIELEHRQKFIYMISGSAKLILETSDGDFKKTLIIKKGDSVIIGDVLHKVIFGSGSKALEIKQGPYEE
jgi:mannose-6-phosphate isomerase-like protein (cupin superfamily)